MMKRTGIFLIGCILLCGACSMFKKPRKTSSLQDAFMMLVPGDDEIEMIEDIVNYKKLHQSWPDSVIQLGSNTRKALGKTIYPLQFRGLGKDTFMLAVYKRFKDPSCDKSKKVSYKIFLHNDSLSIHPQIMDMKLNCKDVRLITVPLQKKKKTGMQRKNITIP